MIGVIGVIGVIDVIGLLFLIEVESATPNKESTLTSITYTINLRIKLFNLLECI